MVFEKGAGEFCTPNALYKRKQEYPVESRESILWILQDIPAFG